VSREIRIELDPARLLALRATAADVSPASCAQIQQEGFGGPRRRRRRRTIGAYHRYRRSRPKNWRTMEIALTRRSPGAPRPTGHGRPIPSPSNARRRLLNGKPVVGFEIVRSRGAGEVEVAEGVRALARQTQDRASRHHDHRGLQFRRPGGRKLRRIDVAADRRVRSSPSSSSGSSCATGGPPSSRRRRCRCRSSRPSP
jgi:hypothetical protein